MNEAPGIDVLPVLNDQGFVVVFDLWVAGKWIGSRRTAQQCEDWLCYVCGMPIEATPGAPW